MTCPACAAEVDATSSSCPRCQTPIPPAWDGTTRLASDDVTRLAPAAMPRSRPSSGSGSGKSRSESGKSGLSTSSGWLASGAIDHGRFEPGTLLGGRYRIVGRLGRGGMGEVYRADDLKLGQPVALKFLPPDVDGDPVRLTQLHTEVRMARQVSHANVCRVYDIDEVDGHTFLSMEYVDGEDLASLLRRIGRFAEDRALEIARQICAGLAAAHDRGVVHRDFKPANVMLDGSGKVRITDFGLAGVDGEAIRAGTPAYMAPEQLAGAEVTARSDIYALGLVLYEIFTGQRALDGKNIAELIRMREQSAVVPPSAIVRDLQPDIERAILRCLRPDPAERPATALAVSAMLPGGDPLAAALAAGETPSPELVAAAGGSVAIAARTAIVAACWITASIIAIAICYQRVLLINRVPTPKTPEALEDRAVEALTKIGYPVAGAAATASGLGWSLDYANYVAATSTAPDRWSLLAKQRPEAFYLWYRTSPRALVPFGRESRVVAINPPLNVGGMTIAVIDASGRLAEFIAVPQPIQDAVVHAPTDWTALFDVAGLPKASFSPVAPRIAPPVFADERVAWEGRLPEQPEHLFRIEGAGYAGKPVYFVVSGPWTRSSRAPQARVPFFNVIIAGVAGLVLPGLMVLGAVLARRNVTLGRGDRQGAFRAATFVVVAETAAWILGQHATPFFTEIDRFFAALGTALFDAALLWLTYLGLEPYVRRSSPDSLIGWTRLLAGRWRDPRVGTDVMIGVCAGLAMTVFFAVHNVLPALVGRPEPMPHSFDPTVLLGGRWIASAIVRDVSNAVQQSMLGVVGIAALRIWLKKPWLAATVAIVVFTPVALAGMFPPGTPWLDVAMGTCLMTVFVVTIVRFGLLATMAALATHFVLLRAPVTLDLGSWRGPVGLWFLATVAVAGFGAAYIARNAPPAQLERQPLV